MGNHMECYQVFDFKVNNDLYQHIIEKIEEVQGFATRAMDLQQ
jgi:hypothetical protein